MVSIASSESLCDNQRKQREARWLCRGYCRGFGCGRAARGWRGTQLPGVWGGGFRAPARVFAVKQILIEDPLRARQGSSHGRHGGRGGACPLPPSASPAVPSRLGAVALPANGSTSSSRILRSLAHSLSEHCPGGPGLPGTNPTQPRPAAAPVCGRRVPSPTLRRALRSTGEEDRMHVVSTLPVTLCPLHAPALPVPDSYSSLQEPHLQVTQGNTSPQPGPRRPPRCTSLDWRRSWAYWCPRAVCTTPQDTC